MALVFSGCYGSGDGEPEDPTRTGLERDNYLQSQRDFDLLCDWSASRLGGYGSAHRCGVLVESTEECVDANIGVTFTNCALTVGQWEDCVNSLEGDPCALDPSNPSPVCAPFLACDGTFF